MIRLALITTVLFLSFLNFGQNAPSSIGSRYDTATIQHYSSSKFKLNGKTLKRKELKALLLSKPESAEAYNIYRKNRTISNVLWIAAGSMYVSSIIMVGYNPEAALGLLGGSVAAMLTTIPSEIKSDRSIHKAVWLYNRKAITGEGLAMGEKSKEEKR